VFRSLGASQLKTVRRVILLALQTLILAGCRSKENSASEQHPVPAQKTQNVPPTPAVLPQTQVNYETDPIYQQAQALSHSDIHKAMELLEAAIAKAPDGPNTAPYYLSLGRLKKEFESCQQDPASSPLSDPAKQCNGFAEYVQAHSNEYFYNEIGGDYLYSGFQFQELEKRFPASPLAIDAAYEMTLLSQGGECEGFLDCYIENGFSRVREFLLRYPDTPHTTEAVKRADDAFRKTLWGDVWKTEWTEIKDPNKPGDYYDPQNLKKLIQEYEDLAEKLPMKSRASCWETIAYYRRKFGEKDQARALYQRILKENPEYENVAEIRRQISSL
jgi:tetratricopeptide (TPR) repeat protein